MRELARLAEIQLNAVRRELANLEKLNIIIPAKSGESTIEEIGTKRSKYYKLNSKFFLLDELKALLVKAKILEEQNFIDDILKRGGNIKLLLLAGSFVGDDEAPTDMLIVGNIKSNTLARQIRDLEKFLGRQLRYTIMEEKEFLDRREIGDKFLYSIFESKNTIVADLFHFL
jgi:DNA-binding transcriptional regulator YhcF (GntR family)